MLVADNRESREALPADVQTYTMLMSGFVASGKWQEALATYRELGDLMGGQRVDAAAHRAALAACAQGRDWRRALEIFQAATAQVSR
jgi:pentatricopeptide repeat protein